MARGDAIEVRFPGVTPPVTARATKAGRRLVQTYKTRAKVQWMDIDEVTRGGRPTGNRLSVRLDQVAAIIETKVDVPVPAKGDLKKTALVFEKIFDRKVAIHNPGAVRARVFPSAEGERPVSAKPGSEVKP